MHLVLKEVILNNQFKTLLSMAYFAYQETLEKSTKKYFVLYVNRGEFFINISKSYGFIMY